MFSVLDVGSNTVHLLLLDVYLGARPEPYASHKTALRLVDHQDEQGADHGRGPDPLDRVQGGGARDFAVEHRAEDLLAFATSAIREAANGAQVLEHVQSVSGVTLTELSGDQEAAITFSAVRRWFGWSAGRILDLDIGGGSFEMAIGTNALPTVATSVPLGAGRLYRAYLAGDDVAPLGQFQGPAQARAHHAAPRRGPDRSRMGTRTSWWARPRRSARADLRCRAVRPRTVRAARDAPGGPVAVGPTAPGDTR